MLVETNGKYYKNGEEITAEEYEAALLLTREKASWAVKVSCGEASIDDVPEAYREEVAQMIADAEAAEREYWVSVPYDEAVNSRIRERYSESAEFAILRQRDEKAEEYAQYYAYCEDAKAYVKEMKEKYTEGGTAYGGT